MNTISHYFTLAELALAAYSNLFKGISKDDYITALENGGDGLSIPQAENFAANWTVIDQYDGRVEETYVDEFGQEHTFLNPTGLSATVFENIADGKRYLAIRGTEIADLSDIATDIIDIGALGTAKHQDQYAALTAKVQAWLRDGTLQPGFTVTGHSLGGFLATNLALDYPAAVAHTYLFNAPGVTGVPGGDLLGSIVNALSPGRPVTIPDVLSITNIVAPDDVVSDVGLYVAPPIILTVESQSPIGAHSIAGVVDALAICNLFATLDPSLSVETIGGLLSASSNQGENTLESSLSALGAIFSKSYPATETSRDSFYANLYELEDAIAQMSGSGLAIEVLGTTAPDGSLTPLSPSAIEALARNEIAYRYALVNGNPFAVLGADYSVFNQDGALDIYNPATGQGQLSNRYLADRAEFLACLIKANLMDTTDVGGDGPPILFTDIGTNGENISVSSGTRGSLLDQARYTFGSPRIDTLAGSSNDDRLYGMNGNDTLLGFGGDDYLEGGVGNDSLNGGNGNDVLNGGEGEDTYHFQLGGGQDTVIDSDGKGKILVADTKGNLLEVVAGEFVQSGSNSNQWTNASGTVTLTHGASWVLTLSDGSTITLGETFNSGDLGIDLVDADASPPEPQQTDSNILGDCAPVDADPNQDGVQLRYDNLGNVVTDPDRYEVRDDILNDSADNDHIISGGGDDAVNLRRGGDDLVETGDGEDTVYITRTGNSVIDLGDGDDDLRTEPDAGCNLTVFGGAGRDYIGAGSGRDTLVGGADGDGLFGSRENDLIYGDEISEGNPTLEGAVQEGSGLQGDWVDAADGNDRVFTGAGNDLIAGGAGNDLLVSGGGSDWIW